MSTNRFAGLKARAAGQTARATDAVTDYIADLDQLTGLGLGMVLTDRFLPFLQDAQAELVAGLSNRY